MTSGPLVAARPVLVPDALDAADHEPVVPGVLSDFTAPTRPNPPATRTWNPATARSWCPHPSASIYLDDRPVDLRGARRWPTKAAGRAST